MNCLIVGDDAIACSGPCKARFHVSCLALHRECIKELRRNPQLRWHCSECTAAEDEARAPVQDKAIDQLRCDLSAEIASCFSLLRGEFLGELRSALSSAGPPANLAHVPSEASTQPIFAPHPSTPAWFGSNSSGPSGPSTKRRLIDRSPPLPAYSAPLLTGTGHSSSRAVLTVPPTEAKFWLYLTPYQPDCMVYGHRRDSGYQTFLYSNVAEVRRVFMFLIEQLPKETTDSTGTETPVDRVTDLENRIVENMQQQLRSSWRKDHQGSPLDLRQGDKSVDCITIDSLHEYIGWIAERFKPSEDMLLFGDFNMPTIAWKADSSGSLSPSGGPTALAFTDGFAFNGLQQISEVSHTLDRQLDLIFANPVARASCSPVHSSPLPLVAEDNYHPALEMSLSAPPPAPRTSIQRSSANPGRLCFRKCDYGRLSRLLRDTDWSFLDTASVDDAASSFSNIP
uniref:CCDC22 N-terminal domain-containing protein n=1 Tax=Anopheles atroparvus TaxID=41427 RepID=A0A182INJ0_ANOAO